MPFKVCTFRQWLAFVDEKKSYKRLLKREGKNLFAVIIRNSNIMAKLLPVHFYLRLYLIINLSFGDTTALEILSLLAFVLRNTQL